MELHRGPRRLRSAVALGGLLASVLTFVGATEAPATQDVKSERIAGNDRFATAAAAAVAGFPDGSDTVVVASGRSFPDALAGAALGVPVLLTERDTLPSPTATAIDTLDAETVLILGGTAAVSDAVANEIAERATVTRIAGANRYETAADVATEAGASGVGVIDELKTAIIATGANFADALAGGPLATGGAGAPPLPILLVAPDAVPQPTRDALEGLGIEQALILGGTGAVSAAAETEIEGITGNPAVRLAGANRFATAVAIADYSKAELAFPLDEALLASGLEFADALAGGPLGGVRQAPLLLTDPAQLPDESRAWFEKHSSTVATITTLGGTGAVSQTAAESAATAAQTPAESANNETLTVAPKAAVDQANGSTREYTVTRLGGTAVDIALVDCDLVTTAADGNTVLANANRNSYADATADSIASDEAVTPAHISSIQGDPRPSDSSHTAYNDDYADDVAPGDDGSVTFVVSGPSSSSTTASCVTPVVFVDVNNDDALNVPTDNPALPSEAFGTGGDTRFSPSGFGGTTFNVNVDDNPDASDRFVGCTIEANDNAATSEIVNSNECATFRYDANDTFQLSGAPTTMATFETLLSKGDDVRGTYRATAADVSVFDLYQDEEPKPPTITPVPATPNRENPETTSSSVTIYFNESPTPTTDSYRLYRTNKTSSTCPTASTASNSGYRQVGQPVPDNHQGTSPADPRHAITDTSANPSQTYCYFIVAVDDGDEGPPSAIVEATTDAQADTSRPQLLDSRGSGGGSTGFVTPGDTHTFTFDDVMDPESVVDGSYSVQGANGTSTMTINCGQAHLCSFDGSNKVLTIRIGGVVPTQVPNYPLTITAISGFANVDGLEITIADVVDPTIQIGT